MKKTILLLLISNLLILPIFSQETAITVEQEQALRAATEPAEGVVKATGASAASKEAGTQGETSPSPVNNQKKKLSFKEQKEFEQLNEEIPALEAEQKALEEKMSSSNFDQVRAAGDRYKEIDALLAEKYPRWEELAERA